MLSSTGDAEARMLRCAGMRSPPEVTISTSASGNSPETRLKLAVAGAGDPITWSEKLVGDMTTMWKLCAVFVGWGIGMKVCTLLL
jgi:hypothetical protein